MLIKTTHSVFEVGSCRRMPFMSVLVLLAIAEKGCQCLTTWAMPKVANLSALIPEGKLKELSATLLIPGKNECSGQDQQTT